MMYALILLLCLEGGQDLSGSWKLVRQDGTPANELANEILHLYPDGQMMIDGTMVQRGKYELNDGKLITILFVAGKEVRKERTYKLDGKTLTLSLSDGSSAYEKQAGALPDWSTTAWREIKEGYFTLEVPGDWVLRKDPVSPNGGQKLTVQEPDGLSAMTLMRIPGRGQEVDLKNALKGVMAPVLQGLEIQKTVIEEFEDAFYNRVGVRLETNKKKEDQHIWVHTFGQKLNNDNYLVAIFSFVEKDRENLEKIMASLKTPDDPDFKKAKAELDKKREEEKKAKEKDSHDHSHGHGHDHKH